MVGRQRAMLVLVNSLVIPLRGYYELKAVRPDIGYVTVRIDWTTK
jgi:hypothetical protein